MSIHELLKEKFGFEKFRTGQEEVIRDVIAGKDTIAILPTGIGKSLCYQLPAYVLKGSVLIVSPLVALMEDQVAIMKRNGEKRVVALNSFLSYSEKNRIMGELDRYKFIFISPEMLLQQNVTTQLRNIHLGLIVVDEAHCISQWGFDFRPDYLRLGEFFEGMNRPGILALTATADDKVKTDICRYLQLQMPAIHKQSLDRPNISYSVVKVDNGMVKTDWIKNRVLTTVGPGIIYVASRKRADDLSALLQLEGVSVASYHAGKEQEDRAFIQEQFITGEISWICATNAFGMGIHKDDIRQVIHEHVPQAIASYIQEVGRAGRDGELSAATLLFSSDDEGRTRFIIQDDIPQEWEIKHYESLLAENYPPAEAAELARISETGKRVIDYYIERMSVQDVVIRMHELIRDKEAQLQIMLRLVHSERCIREEILGFFGEACGVKPKFCCSVCGIAEGLKLDEQKPIVFDKRIMDWEERLARLLG
ncbi:ATP-dependent DNA helicase RecQ [Sporosarcina sp. ANT_H38]|uniref:RecQ family ATP-dependent DNA helicase n=1 Tax=Sporosarcina sp. ANT_H38 TaxID=2597358 RepID=UPI0011F1B5B0|nr:ATP-dependent DNA helicase RecQ [Sporosarcina sp. ANT_H38]KAA0966157.1 ATP-dependent DNA helicase RecQ [Sporosarcina sp. ANT_H38]